MPIIGACATKDYPTEMDLGWAEVLDPVAASLARPAQSREDCQTSNWPPQKEKNAFESVSAYPLAVNFETLTDVDLLVVFRTHQFRM